MVTVDPVPLNCRSHAMKSDGLIVPVAPSVVIVPTTEPPSIVRFTLYTVALAGEAATANIAAAQPSKALTIFTWWLIAIIPLFARAVVSGPEIRRSASPPCQPGDPGT